MKLTSALSSLLALLVALLPLAGGFGGKPAAASVEVNPLGWDVACDYQYTAAIDPIVMPDNQDAGHLHDFFGAEVTRTSTYDSLRAANANNCSHVDDESGYWFPAFYDRFDNKVQPRQAKAYYRVAPRVDPNLIQPWPQGLEIIAGNHMAVTGQTMNGDGLRRAVRWFCGGKGEGETALSDLPSNCTHPDFPYVGVTVVFPDCTVEQITPRDDVDHQSHMRYSNTAGECPASHPRHVPRLGLLVTYNTSDGVGGYIDSNRQPERTAYGMHADFMDGWTQDRVAALIEGCMRNRSAGCGSVRTRMLYPRVFGPGTVREVTPAARLTCAAPVTTPPGTQGAACPTRYGLGDTVSLQAQPAPGYRLAGWQGVAGPTAVRCDGADANHFLATGPCTFRVVDESALEARFVEATPPETTITAGPPAFTNSAEAVLGFTANETGARFECALDGGAFGACTSGQTFPDLADGPHTFDVRAIDLTGNVDASPARHAWQIDTVAPTGSILIDEDAEVATSRNVTLTLSATDPDPGSGPTQMRFRNGATGAWSDWRPFAATASWTLTDGAGGKQVVVQFRDAAGNLSAEASDSINRVGR